MSKEQNNESVESLVSAILDNDETSATDAFNVAMAEKLQARLDDMKVDIARELLNHSLHFVVN